VAPDPVLSLDEAVAISLEQQPKILEKLAKYAAARYRVNQELSPLLPKLDGSVSAIQNRSISGRSVSQVLGRPSRDVPASGTSRSFGEAFDAQVTMSQLLFDFGKTIAATDAAKKNAQVALEDVELQRQLITQSVKEAYTNVNFAQRLILVQRQALERAELNFKSAKGFFEVGTRPKSDVARAAVDVANAKVDLIRAVNAERTAKVALNTAMGYQADRPLRVQDNLVYTPTALDTLPKLMDEALRQRPEYRQAKLSVEANDAKERQTFRNFFPDLTGAGTYGGARTDFNEQWSATLSLTWSIYDGGNRIAKYQEAKALTEAARANVKATELDISKDVESAQIAVQETSERIQAAQTAVESAQENFRLAQGRFDAGVGTILDLTDAQSALNQALNGEALALADYRIALARLDRAVGRR
jgi:outer membrane protein TolC